MNTGDMQRRVRPPKALRAAYTFFMEHAGYSTPPGRAKCALDLARAEAAAKQAGLVFHWEHEEESWESVHGSGPSACPPPDEALSCAVFRSEEYDDVHGYPRRGADCLASLGMIGFNNKTHEDRQHRRDYSRVVEAELAQEALARIAPTPSHWMAL